MPDAPDKVAFLYGPVVLAADLGPAPQSDTVPYAERQDANVDADAVAVPVLVRGEAPLEKAVVRSADGSLVFHTVGVGSDVTLRPFWEIKYDRYNVYWDVLTREQWSRRDHPAAAGL